MSIVMLFFQSSFKSKPVILVGHRSVLDVSEHQLLIFGGGGNCFSFGTLFNPPLLQIRLPEFN